jgi:hypothetical protein
MNKDFIKRALHVTSFNLNASDFQSTKYKNEIQHIFNMHFFPKFNLKDTIESVDMNKINTLIEKLKREDSAMFSKMHNYNLKGVGPGEVTLYFLVNSAHLGGGSSAGVDLIASNGKFEVKAVDVTASGYATNFKLGGTFNLSDIVKDLLDLKKKVNATGEGVNKAALDAIRKKYPDELKRIEADFAQRAYDNYFKNHEIIFIKNSTKDVGKIMAIKKVKKSDIMLDRLTSGVLKPNVKL